MKIGASGEGTKVPVSGETGVKPITEEDLDISKWKTYRNEEYGFEFKYPESIFELNADVSANDTLVIYLVRKFDIHRSMAAIVLQINLYESKTKRIALPRSGAVDFLGKKGRILSYEVHVPDEMKAYYSIVNNGTCNHGGGLQCSLVRT